MKLLFENRIFSFIFIGEFFASLSNGISLAVFGFWLYNLTNSVIIVSLSSAFLMAGPMIWGAVVEKFVDKINPITSMLIVFLMNTISAIIPIFVLDIEHVYLIFIALLINGFAITLANALWPVATTLYLESDQLNKAEGLMGVLFNVRIFVGTFVGGTLYSVIGPYNIFKLESVLFFIGFILLIYLRFFILKKEEIRPKIYLQDDNNYDSTTVKGYLFNDKIIRKALFITIFSQIGFAAMNGLWVPFISELYKGTEQMLSFTYMAQGLGGLVGSFLIMGKLGQDPGLHRVKWKFMLFFVSVLSYTLFDNFYLLLILIIIEGIILEWGLLPLQLIWLKVPPERIRGIIAVKKQKWISLTSLVSTIISGILAEIFGIGYVFVGIAVIMFLTSIYSWNFDGKPLHMNEEMTIKTKEIS